MNDNKQFIDACIHTQSRQIKNHYRQSNNNINHERKKINHSLEWCMRYVCTVLGWHGNPRTHDYNYNRNYNYECMYAPINIPWSLFTTHITRGSHHHATNRPEQVRSGQGRSIRSQNNTMQQYRIRQDRAEQDRTGQKSTDTTSDSGYQGWQPWVVSRESRVRPEIIR